MLNYDNSPLKRAGKNIEIVTPETLRRRLEIILDRFVFIALYRVGEDCLEVVDTITNILIPHKSESATNLEEMKNKDLQTTLSYKRILVVDDDPTVRESCLRIFSQHDYQVEVAASAKEGLERSLHGNFDCALIDLKMPDMDGMEVVRNVRKTRNNMSILIITGYGTDESAREATRLGVSDYLRKPFSPDELIRAVKNTLKGNDRK